MADRYPHLRRAAARCLVFAVFAALTASAGSATASSWIVFDCYFKICRVPAGGGPLQVIGPSGAGWPALSPDGRHLAYEYRDDVYLADPDGTNSHLVSPAQGDVSDVVWRRDSAAFLWSRYTQVLGQVTCRLVLGQSPECSSFTGQTPTWGPSDHRLLRTDPDAGKTICVATLTGQCRRIVAAVEPPGYFAWGSALSPNGELVAAPEASETDTALALYDQRTARRVRVVTRDHEIHHPAWSPGGGKLVFERLVVEPITGAPTRYDICRVSVDGGPVRCLATGPYYHSASWGL